MSYKIALALPLLVNVKVCLVESQGLSAQLLFVQLLLVMSVVKS